MRMKRAPSPKKMKSRSTSPQKKPAAKAPSSPRKKPAAKAKATSSAKNNDIVVDDKDGEQEVSNGEVDNQDNFDNEKPTGGEQDGNGEQQEPK